MSVDLHGLLSRGYFPKELPPPFTTINFATAVSKSKVLVPTGTFTGKPRFSPACMHNLVRTGGLRRNLAIPNPKHFFRLADHVVANQSELFSLASSSPISLTKPTPTQTGRAITPEHGFDERTYQRSLFRTRGKYLLKTDISRFFPSIYTHSIPWAILKKFEAKRQHNSGSLKNTWPDKLDTFSRSVNNNQTVGIPIGPDSSRLIAEIILSRIDLELKAKFRDLKGFRFIDDYEFVFPSRSRAESALSYLQHLLSEYELALNPNKTAIIELPEPLESVWVSRLRTFVFRSNKGITGQKNDLTAYFDLVFDFFKRFPEEGMIKYAIARLKGEEIHPDNWGLYENLLCQSVLIEPACIPQVCDQLLKYQKKDNKLNKKLWSQCLNQIVIERTPLGHASEAAWAMWLMKLLDLKLLVKSTKHVAATNDSIVGLMGLMLVESGLAPTKYISDLFRFEPNTNLFSSNWLLCYEGNLRKWLGSKSGIKNLRQDPAFQFLESRDVSFLNLAAPPPKETETPGVDVTIIAGSQ